MTERFILDWVGGPFSLPVSLSVLQVYLNVNNREPCAQQLLSTTTSAAQVPLLVLGVAFQSFVFYINVCLFVFL